MEAVMTTAAASSHSFLFPVPLHSPFRNRKCLTSLKPPPNPPSLFLSPRHYSTSFRSSASVSTTHHLQASPDDLVASILSMVAETDRGVLLSEEEKTKVAELAQELQRFCVSEPVKSPLIFGDWDVVYTSVPGSTGGPFRSAVGRFILRTKEVVQIIKRPNIVVNRVSFSLFGLFDGEVCLKGKLKVLDEKWIQVDFENPRVKVGHKMDFVYGSESEVQLEITYIEKNIRLGKGSKGSLFVFQRRK